MPFKIIIIFQIFTSIIIFSLFLTGNCLNNQDYKIFNLFNEKIVVVSQMKIHFFNYQMDEDKTKRLVLEKPLFLENGMEKIELSQFSDQDGEYIMILINSIIYFFDKDGNRISYSYLSDSLKEYNYNLIPYKKENNYLHYLITYPAKNKKSFNIEYFKFDINYPHSNQLLSSKNIQLNQIQNENNYPINISKINCIFMSHSKLNREILVCFYAFSYIKTEIQIKSFDPLYDFNEISEFFRKYEIKEEYFEFPKYISGIANKEKNKALIYFINGYSYMMNFDFENWLSEPIKILNDNHFKNEYSQHKILYFKKSDETLVISSVKYIFCKLYVIHFSSNFDIKYKEVIDLNEQCKNLDSFSSFLDGKIYKIINENQLYYLKRLNKNKRNLNARPEKCATATEESLLYNLCTSCADGYLPAETPRNITYDITFVDCYSNTSHEGFYLDGTIFKPCHEACKTCMQAGDNINSHCTKCANHYHFDPNKPEDCVAFCTSFYYYTFYGQYKCTEGTNCPEESPLYLFEKSKCTSDCSKEEDGYQYQYGGICYHDCPHGTTPGDDKICVDSPDTCGLSQTQMAIESNSLINTVDIAAMSFAQEFKYDTINTIRHISYYFNKEFSFVVYHHAECIDERGISITKMDFGDCYDKVLDYINLEDNSITYEKLIVALIERKNEKGQSISLFYFYHPKTGKKLDADEICKDSTVTTKKDVQQQMNNTDKDFDSMKHLTEQNIDIFNLDSKFYTDICFHFDSPNGKDVPLKDRITAFYPNISLCDDDCVSKGVNLTSMESICECSVSGILNNDLISGNALLENTFGDVAKFISNSNLDVLGCGSDVFNAKYMAKNTGGIIILIIFGIQIIFGVLFFTISFTNITRYLYNLTEFFSSLVLIRTKGKENIDVKEKNEKNDEKDVMKLKELDLNAPPPKKEAQEKIKKKKKEIKETEIKDFKKTIRTVNKLDIIDDNNNNLNSQKSFDRLFKDKSLKSKLREKTIKKEKNLEKNEKQEKEGVEIYKTKQHQSKKEVDNEIKNIREKFGVNEEEYLKTEFDDMEYDDAIKYDTRTFCEYFKDKLLENQIFLNTFFNKDSLKPMTIKVILLLLNIDLYFVINGLFYSESYISELFHSTEEEKFFSFFPRSISRFFYTSVVGVIVSTIMGCIFIEEKKIKRIFMREKENYEEIKYQVSLIIKSMKKNFIIFMIICGVISLFSWYYVSCFNNVYPGVKVEWIKSSITIMLIMQILSFLAGLLVAIIRLISFKCKSEKLYKLKDFFN